MSYYDDPVEINLPCGATAHFCYEAGYGYRCTSCNAVVGSVGMPRECKLALDKENEQLEILCKLKGNTKHV